MQAIAALFDQTTLCIIQEATPTPAGAAALDGRHLQVAPLPAPAGQDFRRKLALAAWLPRYLPHLWQSIRRADAIHTPVPGDIGFIGILLSLAQGKPLFVRHCGTWGEPVTVADRALLWLLERIAGGRNVVLATGGSKTTPSKSNPNIRWVFSTTLSQDELTVLPLAQPWQPDETLRLVSVGRLAPNKNMAAILSALPLIAACHPQAHLDIAGDGESMGALQAQARSLGIEQQITFHGNLSHENVLKVLSQAHIFVFPTRVKEGFPKAVLEAMACGLPVIATRVSVIPELLKNGAGRLLDDTGPQAVAQALLEITADPEQLAEMGRQARLAAKNFTLEAWGEAIGNHLRQVWGPLHKGETE